MSLSGQDRWVKTTQDNNFGTQTKLGRWCSRSAPGPIISSRAGSSLKVVFKTDLTGSQSGFLGIYSFKKAPGLTDRCGHQFSTESMDGTNANLFGAIASPNWPNPYKSIDELCSWTVKVRKGFRVLLQFQHFSLEGDMRGGQPTIGNYFFQILKLLINNFVFPKEKGCPNAVVRILKGSTSIPIDLCGESLTNATRHVLSEDDFLKVS